MDEMSQTPFLLWQAIVLPCRVFVYLSFVLFTTMSVMLIILRRDIFLVEWMSVLKTGSRSQETYDVCLVVGQHVYIRHKVYVLL